MLVKKLKFQKHHENQSRKTIIIPLEDNSNFKKHLQFIQTNIDKMLKPFVIPEEP